MNYLMNLFRLFQSKDSKLLQKSQLEHVQSAVRRLRFALGLMVIAVLMGTFGYRFIEGVSWFDAYYMSLVTLSTVGFGEVIPLSHLGRVFTSFLILFNIGFFAYAVSTVTSIFADAEIHTFFSDFKMMQKIQKLQNHTIVCGFGRHAGEVCKELSKQQIPFVVVELDLEKIDLLRRETNYLFFRGDATLDEVLMEAGIERASAIVLTLPLDANNLFIVLSARQLNPNLKIITRLNNAADELKLRRAGANHVVMPEQIGGYYMATLVNKPDLVAFFNLISNMGANHVVFEEIPVSHLKPNFKEKTIAESGIFAATKVPIMGLRYPDGQYQLNPSEDALLRSNMHLVVLGDILQIRRFCSIVLDKDLHHSEV